MHARDGKHAMHGRPARARLRGKEAHVIVEADGPCASVARLKRDVARPKLLQLREWGLHMARQLSSALRHVAARKPPKLPKAPPPPPPPWGDGTLAPLAEVCGLHLGVAKHAAGVLLARRLLLARARVGGGGVVAGRVPAGERAQKMLV